jgi:putative aminopeptidase FrvX
MPSSTRFSRRLSRTQIGLLRALTEAVGVSGGEDPVRRVVRGEIEARVDDLRTDALGNLLAVRRGRGRGRLKVMLAAHTDEVGFMITAIDAEGFLAFQRVGGVDRGRILGQTVWIGEERHPGVIGSRPVHLTSEHERSRRPTIDSLRIDIGASSLEAVQSRVQPGDRASFAAEFRQLGGMLIAKALDDRLGVATLIELLGQSRDVHRSGGDRSERGQSCGAGPGSGPGDRAGGHPGQRSPDIRRF